ncbi:MAG: alginate lyase family protein [Acidobacteria bacterium]|nr:alginate lyase family protein [Acidobacteriota bacterium]MBI3427506.1 alginate lyase family protein [Acidobacteriota bacterium]
MKLTSAFLLILLCATAVSGQTALRLYTLNPDLLQKSKARLTPQDPALIALRNEADKTLKTAPLSVTQKERTPPSGDKHDYLSLAPYWWPNPQGKDGLPYLRRDGETNPDSKRGTDANAIGALGNAVEALSLAYYFTGEARYAERAALFIRTWFLAPATKMNPHFRYAQAVLGHDEGRGAGLIESRHFIQIVNSVGLLAGSTAWTTKDQQALVAWFRAFANWMQTSANGKDEAKAKNNHGSWYAAQLASFALFSGDEALARQTVEAAKSRIAAQFEPDGQQPEELQRTRGLWYAGFNLEALLHLAEPGRMLGVDLYGFQTKDGRGLQRGVDYLAPYADPATKWPHQQINELASARRELAYVLRRAALAYHEPKYEEALNKHLAGEVAQQRWQLLWPQCAWDEGVIKPKGCF